MKNRLLLFLLLASAFVAQGQTGASTEKVVITSQKKKTQVRSNEKGELEVNVSPERFVNLKPWDPSAIAISVLRAMAKRMT